MEYADFMAFLFPQHELMTKNVVSVIPLNLVLNYCHITSVPPFINKMDSIINEHNWFVELIEGQKTKLKYFFGLQNPPEKATVKNLLTLHALGIRFMTLIYEGENEYGGGFTLSEASLTERGRDLLDAMEESEMVLDLSHSNHRTARQAIDYILQKGLKIKVVATHTASYKLYNHSRNFPDDVLVGIRELGGLVGLVTISWLLHEEDDTIYPFLNHLTHLTKLIGDDNVCLGTDSVYQYLNPIEGYKRFKMMKEHIDPDNLFGARHPEQSEELNRADKLLFIENNLNTLNWSKDRIEKIMGKNLIDFFSKL